MTTWLMVADSARARLFEVDRHLGQTPGPGKGATFPEDDSWSLIELTELIHPSSRLHERDMASDAPGLSSVHGMHSKFGMEEKVPPKEEEGIRFAKEVAEVLKAQLVRYDQLYVIAAPHFLGLLRADLDKAVAAKMVKEIDKDLSRHSVEDIRASLPALLRHESLG